jgi:butyryl-CoA dehydrogenase
MDFFGNILIGWLWLDMAVEASNALSEGRSRQTEGFYKGKIHGMQFYFTYELPKTESQAQVLLNTLDLTVAVEDEVFE